jgi:hypothetical protein
MPVSEMGIFHFFAARLTRLEPKTLVSSLGSLALQYYSWRAQLGSARLGSARLQK